MNNKELDHIIEIFKESGYKLTPQRRATLDVMLKNDGKHLSTEEIYLEVKKECPEIGLATVYRTLLLLEKMNILLRHNFDDGRNRYEMNHFNHDHNHHHLICKNCNRVFEVEEDLLEELENKIKEKYDFDVVDHKVQFFGYCKGCNLERLKEK